MIWAIWKYLRVCGEEWSKLPINPRHKEIPPRVRRRVFMDFAVHHFDGNTSACAEKSAGVIFDFWLLRKYLRVCGEETPYPAIILPGFVNFGGCG